MKTAFVNGKIYSNYYPEVQSHTAMVVDQKKVVFVGDDETAKRIGEEIFDLHGQTVLPGFTDSHMHLDETGMALSHLDLRGVESIGEFRTKLQEFSSKSKELVYGWGWDQELFEEKRWPRSSDVDDIVNDRPLLLSRLDGHSCLVNTFLLKILGIKSEDGIVMEADSDYARAKLSEMVSRDLKSKYLVAAMDHYLANGVTSIGFVSCSQEIFGILRELDKKGRLPLRVNAYVNPSDFDSVKDYKDTEFLKLKGIKLFTDGSLGSRTALMSSKYCDFDSYGEQVNPLHVLKDYSKKCEETGRHVAIHAIGDGGIDLAILALNDLGPGNRIEHCAVVRDDQIEKMGGMNLVVQPHFIHTDFWSLDRVGTARAKWVYRFMDFINKGINVAFSTDSPVEPVNPFLGLYSAITRGAYEGIPLAKYTADQKMDLSLSLHCYTKGSAIALNERSLGSLGTGDYADFIIPDVDPFTVDAKEIGKITVREVYVGGQKMK